jgi:hypothetical protein
MIPHLTGFISACRPACLVAGLSLVVGCGSVHNPDNAPAYGMMGGAGVGALVGAASGNAGSGAFIGSLLGNAGGSIVRNERGTPAINEARRRSDIPSILDDADRFDSRIEKDYRSLSAKHSQGYGYDREIAKNKAKGVVTEADRWIIVLRRCESAAVDSVRQETSHPTGRIGHWLKIRDRTRARRASLETHRSWYKFLAS